ncbi:MAG TPA: MFS transporter [Nocardioidaceae bacterium]|nr:MFS transporter [Nocardioidaceae bacterium]
MPRLDLTTRRARDAVAMVFALNGFAFATWVSRIPETRDALGLTPGELGLLLLALSVGSVVALPTAGMWVHRLGAAGVVAAAAAIDAVGLAVAGLGAGLVQEPWLTAVGLFLLGFGSGTWDVAMNVEGAAVEHRSLRTIMPRFHAAFSLGTVVGAAAGAASAGLGLAVAWHLGLSAVLVGLAPILAVRWFLPAGEEAEETAHRSAWRAWREPRTLAIGLMVLALALTEGVANDWLAVALVDGYDVPPWVGASGFALFVTAMTVGRLAGGAFLDRFGRVPVLWGTMAVAGVGVLLVVFGQTIVLASVGIVLWGLGASLGFPVGMSAAADDPVHAPARVSVVSTIGYTAFLAGPPLLGFLGDRVGVLNALLLVAVLLVPSALVVPAARPPADARRPAAEPPSAPSGPRR